MIKLNVFMDAENEEAWLNEQLAKGYRCTYINNLLCIYKFEETTKSYILRVDYQANMLKEDYREYTGIYQDFGWHLVKGNRHGSMQYWQKEKSDYNEIHSDIESTVSYYKRLFQYTFMLWVVLFVSVAILLSMDTMLTFHTGIAGPNIGAKIMLVVVQLPLIVIKLAPFILVIFASISTYKFYKKYRSLQKQ